MVLGDVRRVPYGIADFRTLREGNYLYVDRTGFLRLLEELPERVVLFLRPRRFGKSLWCSTLFYYYDKAHAHLWERLFKGTSIGENPTPLRSSYLVLNFSFSRVRSENRDVVYRDFLEVVSNSIAGFISRYGPLVRSAEVLNDPLAGPSTRLEALLAEVRRMDLGKVYVIIDEYDQFTNELFAFSPELFSEIVARQGFVRKFYEVIKEYVGQGVVDRVFITGIAPLTLDAITSGFNIAKNITFHPKLHDMLGFREEEVREILRLLGIESLMRKLKLLYDGYTFDEELELGRLYNPNMILFFLSEYLQREREPKNVIDYNLRSDLDKLKAILLSSEVGKELLLELLSKGKVRGRLLPALSLKPISSFNRSELLSLAFYVGLLTLVGKDQLSFQFRVPNWVMRSLYAEAFIEELRVERVVDSEEFEDALLEMLQGEFKGMAEVIGRTLRTASFRDMR